MSGLSYEDESFEFKRIYEDLIRQCKHDLFGFGCVIEDIVIDVETLLSERYCKFILDEPCIKILLNDSQSILRIGQIEER